MAVAFYAIQPSRSAVALLLFCTAMLHWHAFSDAGDVAYYVSACTLDVLCALMLTMLRCKLSIDVATLALMGAAANLAGLVMWFAYLPPNVYNASITIITGLQVMRLLRVQGDDMAGDTWFHRWGCVVRGHHLRGIRAHQGEAP